MWNIKRILGHYSLILLRSCTYRNDDIIQKNVSLLNHKLRNHVLVITGITITYELSQIVRALQISTFKNHTLRVYHFPYNVGGNAINCKLIYSKNKDIYSHQLILTCLSTAVV